MIIARFKSFWVGFACAVVTLALGGSYCVLLARSGCLYPVQYVKYDNQGRLFEEGSHLRHRASLFPSEQDTWTLEGKGTRYYPCGARWMEGTFRNDMRVGTFTWWGAGGALEQVAEFDEAGSPKRIVEYHSGHALVVLGESP
jgi:hypothetical protein